MNKLTSKLSIFLVIWVGQLFSLVGSGLTSFALGVWLFQRTGSATQFAMIGFFAVLPRVILSPLMGVLVDRWNRRRVMILSDAGSGVFTLLIVVLLFTNRLQVWHIYLVACMNAVFSTLQWPAYMATTSLLISKENLGRANGLIQFGQAASDIFAPLLAGILMGIIQLNGVILIDVGTCLFAICTLLLVSIPDVKRVEMEGSGIRALWQDMGLGWRFIRQQSDLLFLLGFFAAVNFLWGMVGAVLDPMVLRWASSAVLGTVISIAGAGMFVGGIAMSIWGGPKDRIKGIIVFELISGICFVLMGLRPNFWPVAAGAFGAHVTIAIIYGCNQAIWQSRTPPEIQGRVFATQQMVMRSVTPLAYLLAGPLTDRVVDPLLLSSGTGIQWIKMIIGSEAGRGAGLILIVMGLVKIIISLAAKRNPHLQSVPDIN